jgi:hypothetical protein
MNDQVKTKPQPSPTERAAVSASAAPAAQTAPVAAAPQAVEAPAAAEAPKPPGPPFVPLIEGRMKNTRSSDADIANGFMAVAPAGTPIEHVLRPDYWAHVAHKLRPMDMIDVVPDDRSYYAKLLVVDVSNPRRGFVKAQAIVEAVHFHKIGAIRRDAFERTHEVRYAGPHLKWCVWSLTEDRAIHENCLTEGDAEAWLHARAAVLAA